MRVRFHREAEAELDEALAYYFHAHPSLSAALLEDVAVGERAIAERPQAWRPLERGVRVYWLRRFPYGMIYHVSDSEIVVYALAHMRRRPGYWVKRVS